MGDRLWAGKPSGYVEGHLGRLDSAFYPLRDGKMSIISLSAE